MELEKIIPALLLVIGLINAWLLWAATEGKKERASLEERITNIRRDLNLFEVKVTQEYVRVANLKEIEDRLLVAIDRLGDRLDRLFEFKKT